MITIPVESVNETEGYDSAEEAIAAAKRHPLQAKARQDGAHLAGRRFLDASGGPDHWVLEFSGGLWLRIFPAGREVNWAVEHSRPDRAVGARGVMLEWPSGARQMAASLAAARRGAEFWQFWFNDTGFHVYLRGRRILCFSPVRRRDTRAVILHVWEDD